jgi:predicted nucleic-acid-binding protein
MIGLDTNVVVRILTGDEQAQTRRAVEFIARKFAENDPAFISLVALVETIWVLESVYKLGRIEIAGALEELLSAREIVVEQSNAVRVALRGQKNRSTDLTDALIGIANRAQGCSVTATLDRKAATLEEFVPLR